MFDNRRQSIPKLFEEIATNQERRKYLRSRAVVDYDAYLKLHQDMIRLRVGAQEFLQRKGNTSGTV